MKKNRFRRRRLIKNRRAEMVIHFLLGAAAVVLVILFILQQNGLIVLPEKFRIPGIGQETGTVQTESGSSSGVSASEAEPVLEVIEVTAKPYPTAAPQEEVTADSGAESIVEETGGGINGDALPADLSGDWRLVLVNPSHRLPADFDVEVKALDSDGDVTFDVRAADDLAAMMKACENAGNSIIVRGSYRTMAQQQELFDRKTKEYLDKGMSQEDAEQEAATVIAYPGTSEHQLGLAADIVSAENLELESDQENTKTQQWLMKNCWKYGFILRYPTTKRDITGIIYEPWHYRYVGHEAAKIMYEENLCFEEYLNKYGNQTPLGGTGYVSANGTKGWEGDN
ncbi:MAG: M15 family metallopeptidase [Lachnospiraceae bacterium]|nr:M15 family metallopeptidase [Lachnospiraceae bacterium]